MKLSFHYCFWGLEGLIGTPAGVQDPGPVPLRTRILSLGAARSPRCCTCEQALRHLRHFRVALEGVWPDADSMRAR